MANFSNRNTKILFDLCAVMVIIIAVIIVFRGFLLGEIIAHNDMGNNDLTNFNIPTMYHYALALKQGIMLQWNPYIYGGFPVFAEGQGSFLYPVNIVLYYLFDFLTAVNLFFIFHSVLMGAGAYFLTKKLTGAGWLALSAGIAAALCGSLIIGHNRHLNIYATTSLLPWLILVAENFIQNRKIYNSLLFGSLLGLMLLIGHPQYSFICGFLGVFYLVLRLFFNKTPNDNSSIKLNYKQVILFFGISGLVAILVGISQLLATMEIYAFTERSKDLSEEFTSLGSLPFEGIFTFLYPYFWGNVGNDSYTLEKSFYFWEFFHYSGLIVLILAIWGAVWGWSKSGAVKSLVILAVVAYMLSLGANFFLIKIFSIFPIIGSFRFPSRWLLGTELSLIILSGFGLLALGNLVSAKFKGDGKKKVTAFIPDLDISKQLLIGLGACIVIFLDIFIIVGNKVTTADKDIFFAKPGSSEYINADSSFSRMIHFLDTEYHATVFKKNKGWEGGNEIYREITALLPLNLASIWNIPVVNGYMGLVPDYIYEIWGNPNNPGIFRMTYQTTSSSIDLTERSYHLLRMWGVRYATSPMSLKPPFRLVWDTAFSKLYELGDVYPRAWVVDDVLAYPNADAKEFARLLFNPEIDFRSSAIADEEIKLPANSSVGRAKVVAESYHKVIIKSESAGLLVFSDTWFPRWKAYINGKETKVYKVNGMMRGVISTEPGATIEMKYSSGGLTFFIAMSYLIMALSVAFFFWERRRSNVFLDNVTNIKIVEKKEKSSRKMPEKTKQMPKNIKKSKK